LPIHDTSTWVHEDIILPPYYIANLLIKEGSMMIYGGAGAKKSWLVQHMSMCLSTGTEWLGMHTERARVLLVNAEISPSAFVVYRLRPMERNFHLQPFSHITWSPDEDSMQLALENELSANAFLEMVRPFEPNVIILDCLQGVYLGDENDMETAGRWVRNVRRIQHELHCAIIIVHHTNKNPLATGMGKLRGTSRFAAWVDTLIYMCPQPNGIQLQFDKYRLSAVPELPNLDIDFNDYLWTVRR
jgi:RecA-family ATPase